MGISKNLLLSWGKFLIGWPISFISILFIVKLVIDKGSELNISVDNINLFYLFLGVLTFFIYFLIRSFLWKFELSEKGYKINFRENTYRFAFSELKRYTPGNIWSFLSRASLFSELGVDKKTLGVSILADIQLVIIGCGLLSIFSIPWFANSPDELKIKLLSLLPISLIAIVIFFIVTGFIYSKSIVLHSTRPVSNFLLPGFEFNSKIKLSVLSVFTYAIFGFANYFIFISIYQTNENPLILSSFFVFSLLIGYLSFITPMGLGVREGVITLGLLKITTLANAGAISIFTRIVLIASELLFLIIIFIWEKSYGKK